MESFQRQFNVVDKHPHRCTGKSEDSFKMFSVVLPEENDDTTDSVVYLLFIICIPKKQREGPHGQTANPAFAKKHLSAQKGYHEDMLLSTADSDGYMTKKSHHHQISELARDLPIVVSQSHGWQR